MAIECKKTLYLSVGHKPERNESYLHLIPRAATVFDAVILRTPSAWEKPDLGKIEHLEAIIQAAQEAGLDVTLMRAAHPTWEGMINDSDWSWKELCNPENTLYSYIYWRRSLGIVKREVRKWGLKSGLYCEYHDRTGENPVYNLLRSHRVDGPRMRDAIAEAVVEVEVGPVDCVDATYGSMVPGHPGYHQRWLGVGGYTRGTYYPTTSGAYRDKSNPPGGDRRNDLDMGLNVGLIGQTWKGRRMWTAHDWKNLINLWWLEHLKTYPYAKGIMVYADRNDVVEVVGQIAEAAR